MSHPPIPLNCPHFVQYNDAHFVIGDEIVNLATHHHAKRLVELRAVIAAVARVAWVDEADRLETEWIGLPTGGQTKRQYGLEVLSANEHAKAWKEWGSK